MPNRKTHKPKPQPPQRSTTTDETVITCEPVAGVSFFAEAYQGQGDEGKGLMLLQVQIHPLPDTAEIFQKVVDAMNSAAAQVLRDEGIAMGGDPVHETEPLNPMNMPGDPSRQH